MANALMIAVQEAMVAGGFDSDAHMREREKEMIHLQVALLDGLVGASERVVAFLEVGPNDGQVVSQTLWITASDLIVRVDLAEEGILDGTFHARFFSLRDLSGVSIRAEKWYDGRTGLAGKFTLAFRLQNERFELVGSYASAGQLHRFAKNLLPHSSL